MFERFTDRAKAVMVAAQAEARLLGHDYIGTEHLLLGLLAEPQGVAAVVLAEANVTAQEVRTAVARLVGRGPGIAGGGPDDAQALRSIGIDLDAVRARIEAAFGPGALEAAGTPPPGGRARARRRRNCGPLAGQAPFTARAKKVLELSLREALHLQHNYIGTEHLLLALAREGQGIGAQVLIERHLSLDHLRQRVMAALGKVA